MPKDQESFIPLTTGFPLEDNRLVPSHGAMRANESPGFCKTDFTYNGRRVYFMDDGEGVSEAELDAFRAHAASMIHPTEVTFDGYRVHLQDETGTREGLRQAKIELGEVIKLAMVRPFPGEAKA